MLIEKTCLQCKLIFTIANYRKDTAKFCSVVCMNIYRKGIPNPKVAKALTGRVSSKRIPRQDIIDDIIYVSKHLGFTPSSTEYRKHGRHNYTPLLREFGKYQTALKAAGMSRQGIKNSGSAMAKKRGMPYGNKHPNWKGGYPRNYGPNIKIQSYRARKRAGNKCQNCKKNEKDLDRNLDVHHIVPFKEFNYIPEKNENYRQANNLTNLEALCHSCHAKIEYNRRANQV